MKTIKELETCNCQECKYKADLLKKVVGLIDDLNYKGKSKVLEELKKRITG